MLLGPFDNRRDRDFLPVLLPEKIPDIGVVIGMKWDVRVFYQAFLPAQLMEDILFDLRVDHPGFLPPLIRDRKLRGILAIIFQQDKESASSDLEDVEDIWQLDFFVDIALKQ